MKKIILFVAVVVMALSAIAQTPKISYQAVLRDANNRLVTNTPVTVDVEITYGSNTYTETGINTTTNANGLMSLMIGNAAGYDNIVWKNATIKTTVSFNNSVIESTTNVMAVPYALNAKYVEDVNPNASTIQAIYNKLQADSLALGTRIDANSTAINNRITADSTALHNALKDTAAAIRGDFPTVNDATLTIQKNGTDVGAFTANQSTAGIINITVPTNVSELDGIDAYATLSKVQADSLALATSINNLADKVQADSLALGTLIDNNKAAIADSSAHICANLADTAAAIRGDFPTVNNATLTIKQGTNVLGTFTANQSDNREINIPTPAEQVQANWLETNASQASFIQNKPTLAAVATSGSYNDLSDKPDLTVYATNTALTDSMAKVDARIIHDSLEVLGLYLQAQSALTALGTKVVADSNTLHNALKDTASAIRGDFPTVNDATLTIQKNGTDVGTFTANQSTAGTVNITVPTTVAELTDEDNYAKKAGNNPFSGNNTFSGENDFTSGSITVPNAITNLNTTLNNPCNQNAVNVCDLMAVYDSLNQRIQVLEAVLHAVMDNLSYPTVITSQPSDISASKATLRGEIVSSGITNISGRGFYYNTTGEPNFFNGTNIQVLGNEVGAFTYNLTGLSPNTTYYIRTYAIVSTNNNNGNIYYGDVVSFTTPIPQLSVVPDQESPVTACGKAPMLYTVTMTNDDIANYTLKWYKDDVEQTGETSTTFKDTLTASVNALVVKCVAIREGANAEADTTMKITVNPNPTATLTRLEGNAGEDWGKVQISEAENMASASWKLNDVVLGTWTSGKTEVLPAGTYNVILTSNDGCEITQPLTIRTSPVCVANSVSEKETYYELAGQKFVKTIKDHEDNEYNVVQIGTRCWTRENMRAVTSPTTGSTLITNGTAYQSKSAQWPYNDSETYTANKYGVLYNWCAALDVHHASYPEIAYSGEESKQVVLPHPTANHRGICPEGWHVPVNNDYVNLNSLFPKGGQWATGSDWTSGTAQGPGDMSYAERNISGFSALPAGSNPDLTTGVPGYFHQTAWFCTATEYSATQNWRSPVVYLYFAQSSITGSWNASWTGICQFNHQRLSVRCIKD